MISKNLPKIESGFDGSTIFFTIMNILQCENNEISLISFSFEEPLIREEIKLSVKQQQNALLSMAKLLNLIEKKLKQSPFKMTIIIDKQKEKALPTKLLNLYKSYQNLQILIHPCNHAKRSCPVTTGQFSLLILIQ